MTRLLLVDDDETFRQVLARSMRRHGFDPAEAGDRETALRLAEQQVFDAALVDLRLPGASGLFVVQDLRRLHPSCHIVVLTGFASIATAVEAIKLGADDYLSKPADTASILRALRPHAPRPSVPLAEQPLSVDRLEWEHIHKVLHEQGGNISATARALNMHRRTLQRKLAKKPAR